MKTNLVKISPRISQETFSFLQNARKSYGETIDEIITEHMKLKSKEQMMEKELNILRQEKKLLMEHNNKLNQVLDLLNSMTNALNVEHFMSHDDAPTEMMYAAETKQQQRIRAMRNY